MVNLKSNKTKEILFHIKNGWRTTKEIFEVLPSRKEINRKFWGHMEVSRFNYKEWQWQEEKNFYKLLSKLRKDGLIEKRQKKQQSWWTITKKGLERLKVRKKNVDLPSGVYAKEFSDDWNLVIFDIPEKLKHIRVWLRKQLKSLDFVMLQKSVWIGKCGIPNDLMHDMRNLKILPYLHILKIHKKGSLINLKD